MGALGTPKLEMHDSTADIGGPKFGILKVLIWIALYAVDSVAECLTMLDDSSTVTVVLPASVLWNYRIQ